MSTNFFFVGLIKPSSPPTAHPLLYYDRSSSIIDAVIIYIIKVKKIKKCFLIIIRRHRVQGPLTRSYLTAIRKKFREILMGICTSPQPLYYNNSASTIIVVTSCLLRKSLHLKVALLSGSPVKPVLYRPK